MYGSVPVGGDYAETHYRIKQNTGTKALLRLQPVTGRTHQIRVQCAQNHVPVVGDKVYGSHAKEAQSHRLQLHAAQIEFTHPYTEKRVHLQNQDF